MIGSFLFAAGGTGGHVYPALAVAEALSARCPQARIHFVGGRRGIEGRLVPAAGFPLTRLPAAGLRGGGVLGAVRFCVTFAAGLVGSIVLILRTRPDVVLATGGYASAAPAVAAAALRRPVWIQEQNAVPGSTNRVLARFAERIYVAFEEARGAFARAHAVERLPNPVRSSILRSAGQPSTAQDYTAFGLHPGVPTVLVFGGSRGARSLNRAVREGWPRIAQATRWQLLAQTGGEEADAVRRAVGAAQSGAAGAPPGAPSRACVLAYIDRMDQAYRIADLVVCRAGALTLAELAALGKPAILVPFPHATDDHQTRNAQAVAAAGAARVVPDAQMDGTALAELLQQLEGDPAVLEQMAHRARQLAGEQDGAQQLAAALAERATRNTTQRTR